VNQISTCLSSAFKNSIQPTGEPIGTFLACQSTGGTAVTVSNQGSKIGAGKIMVAMLPLIGLAVAGMGGIF
jgi:hypothetical protein